MEFSKKKLPKEQLPELYRVRIETVKPFALMLGPVYLYFRANEKFVSVKGPLDFFTESEIFKLRHFKYFYFPDFISAILPFREAGQNVRRILSSDVTRVQSTSEVPYPEVQLGAASFAEADLILSMIGRLWCDYPGKGIGVEPYLVTILVNEVCDLIPSDELLLGREASIEKFDKALFRSSWVVFLALHLGYCDLDFLNELRLRIFQENVKGGPPILYMSEVDDLIGLAYESLRNSRLQLIRKDFFYNRDERVAQKLEFRLERVIKEFLSRGTHPPSIFGKRGFIDV